MPGNEPISPSHLVLIISGPESKTDCLEQALHELNIGHRYAILQPTPTAKDFWWDLLELNPDVVIIFGRPFSEKFIIGSIITLYRARFDGHVIVVSDIKTWLPERVVRVSGDNDVTGQLEKIIIEKLKLPLV
jgi:hypothetical protein